MNGTLKNQYPPVLKDLNGTQRHNVGNFKKGSTLCKCTPKHTQQKHSAVFYSTHQHTSNSYKMKKGRKAYHVGQL